MSMFETAYARENARYEALVTRKNRPGDLYNGVYTRWEYPVLTRDHAPLIWRYDLNPETNPFFMERLGVNAVLNAGAIKLNGKYCLIARVEGSDRKQLTLKRGGNAPLQSRYIPIRTRNQYQYQCQIQYQFQIQYQYQYQNQIRV